MVTTLETAVFAGGCFWCTEAIFTRLTGVISVTSGYTGGTVANPSYEAVSSGETGHTEAVKVQFDPAVISYQKLLEVFWATHDPTTLNRQGNDIGTQYRSAIFYTTEQQKAVAEKSRELTGEREIAGRKIVTEIKPLENFYPAEEYHQNYFDKNAAANPYCSLVIAPKIQKLVDQFNVSVKEEFKTS